MIMKGKGYRSNFAKSFWILVAHIAVVALALCAGIFLTAYEKGVRLEDSGKSYIESSEFANDVTENGYEIMNRIAHQKTAKFLESADELAVIDLKEFQENGENSTCLPKLSMENTSGVAYRVKDLLEWEENWEGVSSISYEYSWDTDPLIRCDANDGSSTYFYWSDFREQIADGRLKIDFNRDFWIIDDLENGKSDFSRLTDAAKIKEIWEEMSYYGYDSDCNIGTVTDTQTNISYMGCYPTVVNSTEEKFAPQGAENLLDAVNASSVWNGNVAEAYEQLGKVLNCIREVKNGQNVSQESEGVTYLLADKETGEICTNDEAYNNYAQLEQNLKKIEQEKAYVIIYPQLEKCVTNISWIQENGDLQVWDHTAQTCFDGMDYVFAVCVDTGSEAFAVKVDEYGTYTGRMIPSLCGAMAAVVFLLLSLIWLTVAAGRRPGDEELYLNLFDRWYTEIAAGVVICVWGFGFMGIAMVVMRCLGGTLAQIFGIALIDGVYTIAWFMIGYLSLVRRIKAGTLWKNSLLRVVLRWIAKCFHRCGKMISGFVEIFSRNTSTKLKILLAGAVFLLLQFFCHGIVFNGGAEMLFFLFGVDAAVMIYLVRKADGRDLLLDGVKRISDGEIQYKVPLEKLTGSDKKMAEYINNIGSGLDAAVENSLKKERMQTELITNVSHDLKTPLTSIINYVDLLKRENIQDPKIQGYLKILDEKSQRLKVLTEDVVEASKASTGNIKFEMNDIDFVEMVQQVIGEFEEKFQEKNLTMMVHFVDEPSMIYADGQRLWRVLENIFGNVIKYAMEGTRVYAEIKNKDKKVIFSLKNISAQPLNFSADELTERFIRGDVARNTEGSGLGLSIAKSLTELQGGEFKLYLDGDLFKVMITFAVKEKTL